MRLSAARKINNEEPLVLFYSAIASEYLGDKENSILFYEQAFNLKPLSIEQLVDVVECQRQLEVSDDQRLRLLDQAISLCQKSNDTENEKQFIIERFYLSTGTENFKSVHYDWEKIKEWDSFPGSNDPETLFQKYLSAVELESTNLAKEGAYDTAINLLKPLSIASLINDSDNVSPLLANVIEWENRETPPIKIIKADANWKYLDDGTDQGEKWINNNFDDSLWKEGPGKFGYGGDGEQTKLSFGPDRTLKYRTYYFRHSFDINKDSKKPFLVADIVRDDGVVLYLNGEEIIRDNMPDGEISYSTYSRSTAWEHTRNGLRLYELNSNRHTIDSEKLKIGTNILAAEVHQCNNGSSDLGFQLELLGSNESSSAYINQIISSDDSSSLLNSALNAIPKVLRQKKKFAAFGLIQKKS